MNFEQWITQIIANEKPSKKIKGYFFGIFETSKDEYMMYLTGSKEFNVDDDDWPCNNDFEPNNKYLLLPLFKGMEWKEVLNQVVEMLQKFITTDIFKNSFFANAKGIGTGFDSGCLILIKPCSA